MMREYLGIYLRGMSMGAADLVPGVSGGTVALITGVYERLVVALASISWRLVPLLAAGHWRRAWVTIDGTFLLSIGAGALTSILLLASIINRALNTHPEVLWAFFFGLVAASALLLWQRELGHMLWKERCLVVIGAVFVAVMSLSPAGVVNTGPLAFFLAGAVAICAMILPGVSGSFVLLVLGMYQPVIAALLGPKPLEFTLFILGCGLGLLLFSRLLQRLLDRARRTLMATLNGFLLGSLVMLWPWQQALSTVVDRHGEARVLQRLPVLPDQYQADPHLVAVMAACIAGLLLVTLLHYWAIRSS